MKKLKIIVGIASVVFGILIIVYCALFSGPYQDDQILRVDGVFEQYVVRSSWIPETEIIRYIQLQDGSRYTIDSITYDAFDEDALLYNVKTDDPIKLIIEKSNNVQPSVLAIYKGDQEYMNFEDAQNERRKIKLPVTFWAASFLSWPDRPIDSAKMDYAYSGSAARCPLNPFMSSCLQTALADAACFIGIRKQPARPHPDDRQQRIQIVRLIFPEHLQKDVGAGQRVLQRVMMLKIKV